MDGFLQDIRRTQRATNLGELLGAEVKVLPATSAPSRRC